MNIKGYFKVKHLFELSRHVWHNDVSLRPFGIHTAITVWLHKHNSWTSGIMLSVTETRRGRRGAGWGVYRLMRNKERAIVFMVPQRASFSFLFTVELIPEIFVFPSFELVCVRVQLLCLATTLPLHSVTY